MSSWFGDSPAPADDPFSMFHGLDEERQRLFLHSVSEALRLFVNGDSTPSDAHGPYWLETHHGCWGSDARYPTPGYLEPPSVSLDAPVYASDLNVHCPDVYSFEDVSRTSHIHHEFVPGHDEITRDDLDRHENDAMTPGLIDPFSGIFPFESDPLRTLDFRLAGDDGIGATGDAIDHDPRT